MGDALVRAKKDWARRRIGLPLWGPGITRAWARWRARGPSHRRHEAPLAALLAGSNRAPPAHKRA